MVVIFDGLFVLSSTITIFKFSEVRIIFRHIIKISVVTYVSALFATRTRINKISVVTYVSALFATRCFLPTCKAGEMLYPGRNQHTLLWF